MSKSPTTIEWEGIELDDVPDLTPTHPGEMLLEEFMRPLGISAIGVAKAIGVPRARIERLVKGEVGVSADTALRLSRLLGTTPEFWLNLQSNYDLRVAAGALSGDLAAIKPLAAA